MQRCRWLERLRFVAVLAVIAPSLPSCSLPKDSPLAGQERLPAFPDPVPPPAASLELPAGVVVERGPLELDEAHKRLTSALAAAGFDKWSVYAFKDGFALVTRWEHIEEDGRQAKDRFPARHPKRVRPGFNFDEHAQLLFNAPDGVYRLFVFTVVGTDPAKTSEVAIDGGEVGAGELPVEIAEHSAADWTARAHVYVYRQDGSNKAQPLEHSPLDAATHLASARIFDAARLAGRAGSAK